MKFSRILSEADTLHIKFFAVCHLATDNNTKMYSMFKRAAIKQSKFWFGTSLAFHYSDLSGYYDHDFSAILFAGCNFLIFHVNDVV